MQISVIVPAAGASSRFGKQSKLLWPLCGKPVLYWTLKALDDHLRNSLKPTQLCEFVLPIRDADRETVETLCTATLTHPWRLCLGGDSREKSVRLAVQDISPETTHLLIHDAARPLPDKDLLKRLLGRENASCVIPAIPCVDTLKEIQNDTVVRTISREKLYRVQTPQLFQRKALQKAYTYPIGNATDEAGLCETAGLQVEMVLGNAQNLKLTYQDEVPLFEALLRLRHF